MRLRLGLIGVSNAWQTRYAPALRALADCFEVRAVCDPVRHRAEQVAADFKADAMDGYHALAHREDVDAVLILATHWFGHLPLLAACEAGKSVYCAVGLELEPKEAQRVKRRIEESGVAFVAEFPRRHAPATVRLKELIATQLGAPRLLFCHQRSATSGQANGLAPPNNPTFRQMLGLVDWCCYVVNRPPTSVVGIMHYSAGADSTEDYRMMRTGPTAQISCGRYLPDHWQEAISFRPLPALQVSCERGIAFVDLPATLVWFDEAGRHQESLESERPLGEQLLMQFYRAATSLVRRSSDLEDAYLALKVVHAAKRSHEEGRRIRLA